jgi:hypothetical protein
MRRSFIRGIASRPCVASGFHPVDKRAAELFDLHEPGLLCRHDIIELVQQLILM